MYEQACRLLGTQVLLFRHALARTTLTKVLSQCSFLCCRLKFTVWALSMYFGPFCGNQDHAGVIVPLQVRKCGIVRVDPLTKLRPCVGHSYSGPQDKYSRKNCCRIVRNSPTLAQRGGRGGQGGGRGGRGGGGEPPCKHATPAPPFADTMLA